MVFRQHLHLADGNGVELCQTLCLRDSFVDEHRIQVLQIGQAHKLRNVGIVADVAFKIRVGIAPLFGRHTKQRHIQDIGFIGIDQGNLPGRQFRWDQILLDGIRVNAIIDLGKVALDIPAKLLQLLGLEPLKLFDEVDFEFGADPHTELKGDVLICVCSTISSGLGFETNCVGFFHPFFYADLVAVQASLTSNCGEFAIIKIGVVYLFPNPKELNSVPVSQPVGDKKVTVFGFEHQNLRKWNHTCGKS